MPRQFDYENSQIDLISIDIQDAHTIQISFRLAGKFTPLFLGLKLKPFTGSCVFKTNEKGLIVEQKVSVSHRYLAAIMHTMLLSNVAVQRSALYMWC